MNRRRFGAVLCLAGLAMVFSCNPTRGVQPAVQQRNVQVAQRPPVLQPPVSDATPLSVKFVTDNEGIYTESEVNKIDSLLRSFERSNLISIKLETFDPNIASGLSFDAAHKRAFKEWEALHHDNGKTLLISLGLSNEDAKFSYGPFTGKLISDAEIGGIAGAYRPFFERGDIYKGTWEALMAIMDTIRKNINFNPQKITPPSSGG